MVNRLIRDGPEGGFDGGPSIKRVENYYRASINKILSTTDPALSSASSFTLVSLLTLSESWTRMISYVGSCTVQFPTYGEFPRRANLVFLEDTCPQDQL